MKFGFGKKGDDASADGDAGRRALFGSRSKSKPQSSANVNPYANPVMASSSNLDPYSQENGRRSQPPPPYSSSSALPGDGYHSAQAPYGGQQGYGTNIYGDSKESDSGSRSGYGLGGYGGLGPINNQDSNDEQRAALFGDAVQNDKQQKPEKQPHSAYGRPYGEGSNSYGGRYDVDNSDDTYGNQKLTEEEEEEDVQAVKQEIRFIKQQDVDSTRRALNLVRDAEDQGRNTLKRLAVQGERISNTEQNLDLSKQENRIAEDKARELKKLNDSMFAVHVRNPFTATSRRNERDQKTLQTYQGEREELKASRHAGLSSRSRCEVATRGTKNSKQADDNQRGKSLTERAKYQFEADSDDDNMENEIESNLRSLDSASGRLQTLATTMSTEINEQNKHLSRVSEKTDKVDDQILMNRARLGRIH